MANHLINVNENGTTTLATSGKYCDRDIDVVVEVAGSGGGDFEWPTEIEFQQEINYKGCLDWLWEQAPVGTIITQRVGINYAFYYSEMVDASHLIIDFCDASGNGLHYYFSDCSNMKKLPVMYFRNTSSNHLNFFYRCFNLQTIPEDYFMLRNYDSGNYTSTGKLAFPSAPRLSHMFDYCYSLRKHPILDDGTQRAGHSNQTYSYLFGFCYALDEITNIPVVSYNYTSNQFSSAFTNCSHVNRITFATNNGTPYSVKWSNQTIDLSQNVGYASSASNMTNYNSGLTADTQIKANNAMTEEERIAIATNNPDDWWTALVSYSRYDHDSAVETINSLPDCSTGSGNIIKFNAGSATSWNKAIRDLTEEEIAVATAKGWTVTLV